MKNFLTPTQRALTRVITNSGLVSDPEPNIALVPVAVCKAWESAKKKWVYTANDRARVGERFTNETRHTRRNPCDIAGCRYG